jgi:hypothetical protein
MIEIYKRERKGEKHDFFFITPKMKEVFNDWMKGDIKSGYKFTKITSLSGKDIIQLRRDLNETTHYIE